MRIWIHVVARAQLKGYVAREETAKVAPLAPVHQARRSFPFPRRWGAAEQQWPSRESPMCFPVAAAKTTDFDCNAFNHQAVVGESHSPSCTTYYPFSLFPVILLLPFSSATFRVDSASARNAEILRETSRKVARIRNPGSLSLAHCLFLFLSIPFSRSEISREPRTIREGRYATTDGNRFCALGNVARERRGARARDRQP